MRALQGEADAAFKDLPLHAAPGTEFEYSNSNYLLLQLVIRQLVPSTERYFQEHVLGPAHMTRTSTLDSPSLPNTASGHTVDDSGARVQTPLEDPLFELSQCVIRSTANDLLAWDRALAARTVLSERSQREHLTPHLKGNPTWLYDLVPMFRGYGYGIMIHCNHAHEVQTHSGLMAGFSSHFVRIPAEGWLIVVLSDSDKVVANELSKPVMEMLLTSKPAQIGRETVEPCTDHPVARR